MENIASNKKSGFVVLVGRSNVGKSTLLNTLVGTKIAATSFRAQMTRHTIHGVLNHPDGQAVFVDTPGVFKDKKNALSAKLTNTVKGSLSGIDLIVYVVDPTREIGQEERAVLGMIRHLNIPKLLVINKSDLPQEDRKYQEDYELLEDDFDGMMRLSALRGSHIEPLRERVIEMLPVGQDMYDQAQLTNVNREFWISEIVREKIFSVFDKEVPYSMTVEIDSVVEEPTIIKIEGRILTNQDRYKRMIIGKGGHKIKEVGQMARKELEQATNKKIYLGLEVEVDRHWVDRM